MSLADEKGSALWTLLPRVGQTTLFLYAGEGGEELYLVQGQPIKALSAFCWLDGVTSFKRQAAVERLLMLITTSPP